MKSANFNLNATKIDLKCFFNLLQYALNKPDNHAEDHTTHHYRISKH